MKTRAVVYLSVLNGRKNTQEKKSSLPSRTTLSSSDILDWFKCIKKRKEEKLQDQESVNLTEDNLLFLLSCL